MSLVNSDHIFDIVSRLSMGLTTSVTPRGTPEPVQDESGGVLSSYSPTQGLRLSFLISYNKFLASLSPSGPTTGSHLRPWA
jgi:hypothetical protein